MTSPHRPEDALGEEERGREELLFAAVYEDLRERAAQLLRHERRSPTFTTTDLVHEACARVLASSKDHMVNAAALRAIAGRAMRQVLVERARYRGAEKRIARERLTDVQHLDLDLRTAHWDEDVLLLDQLITLVARKVSKRAAHAMELRLFAGLTTAEIAEALGITSRSVEREFQSIRDVLTRELRGQP